MNRRSFTQFLALTALPIPPLVLKDEAKWTGIHKVTQEGEWQVHELDFPGAAIDIDYFHIVADSQGDHSYFKMRVRPGRDANNNDDEPPTQEVYDDFLTEPTREFLHLSPDIELRMNPH